VKIAVIGLGQSLRGDDAAGLEAVRTWQQQFPESAGRVSVELSELPGLGLLDLLDGMDAAVLVDALHSPDHRPGHLFILRSDDLAAFSPDAQSAHGWGVAETLSLGLRLYPALRKCRISLIGIAGSQFELGAGLSPGVLAGLSEAAALIEKEVRGLL
jgi:hydrogenase maturation protease